MTNKVIPQILEQFLPGLVTSGHRVPDHNRRAWFFQFFLSYSREWNEIQWASESNESPPVHRSASNRPARRTNSINYPSPVSVIISRIEWVWPFVRLLSGILHATNLLTNFWKSFSALRITFWIARFYPFPLGTFQFCFIRILFYQVLFYSIYIINCHNGSRRNLRFFGIRRWLRW